MVAFSSIVFFHLLRIFSFMSNHGYSYFWNCLIIVLFPLKIGCVPLPQPYWIILDCILNIVKNIEALGAVLFLQRVCFVVAIYFPVVSSRSNIDSVLLVGLLEVCCMHRVHSQSLYTECGASPFWYFIFWDFPLSCGCGRSDSPLVL